MEYLKFIPEECIENFHTGQIVKGIVKNIRNYGVFVEIGDGITRTFAY
jgi:ribosomal protein S1